MTQQTEMSFENIEKNSLANFAEQAYLNYSMYVILDRALPSIADGLKPVQRRIIYAMSELNLSANAKFKKSARTVGDVLGKFHPHGDSACYEAMVLMAQDFSYRYPLVDGQGNWGSADDPKSFAAMRYTESRLTAYADLLLKEINQGTVDWQANFDGTLKEPKLLPARLPNILLNGTMGIAVGMSTDIPPHNLREVTSACIHLLDNPKAKLEDIIEFIQGPDYPTEAEIISPREELLAMYQRGLGSVRMRAVHTREQSDIVITALPHQVSGAKIIEQIAHQMRAKKLPMVADLRDESDHENPTRIVIMPRSNRIDYELLMNHLFATTDLEKTYRVNLNMIGIDGRPQVKNLLTILNEWLLHRRSVLKRRLQCRLDKVLERLHILDGLLIAFLNLDEVIRIIREEDKPKQRLIARFDLTNTQAEAILDLKLRHLAKLEEMKIRDDQKVLNEEREGLEKIIDSERRLKTLLKKELSQDMEAHGNDRRSPIVQRGEAQAIKAIDMLPSEAITVILSNQGWVRSAKGHEIDVKNLNYKAGDSYFTSGQGLSNQSVIFCDTTGRTYTLGAHSLPSARGQGEPLTGRLNPPPGASFTSLLIGSAEQLYLLASDAGYGFICQASDLYTKNKNGKAVLKLPKNAKPLQAQTISSVENGLLAAVTNEGRLLLFPLDTLPRLARGKGNKIINIPSAKSAAREETIAGIIILAKTDHLLVHAGRRYLNLSPKDLEHYKGERGRRGYKLPKGYQKVDSLEAK